MWPAMRGLAALAIDQLLTTTAGTLEANPLADRFPVLWIPRAILRADRHQAASFI
jgi:hypothetical protein